MYQCPYYILAIDPGSRDLGAAMFHGNDLLEAWTIHTPYRDSDVDVRCYNIIQELDNKVWDSVWCRACQRTHADLVYENTQFRQHDANAAASEAVQRAIGHLDQWARDRGFEVFKYKVNAIKLGVAGRSNASKTEVESVIKHEYNLHEATYSNHAWDAISVGVYHLAQQKLRRAIMPDNV